MSKKQTLKLPDNCSLELVGTTKRDRAFQLRFLADEGEDYVSEVYVPGKGEALKRAAYNVCLKFDWLDEPPGKKGRLIHNLAEFLDWRGCGDDPYHWARAYYKYTDCGPWVNFLELVKPAHEINHPSVVAVLRKVRGKVKLMNPEQVDPAYLQLLALDEHGLDKKEREWDHYCKLVEDYIADEAKQERTKRTLTLVKKTENELHLQQPGRTEYVEADYRKVYYEDLHECDGDYVTEKCGCTIGGIGVDPNDPQEEHAQFDAEPLHCCEYCHGKGTIQRWKSTGKPRATLDPDKCCGIQFGSIVEGSEQCSGPFTHMFPFWTSEWTRDEEYMEKETSWYWKRDNASWYRVRTDDEEWVVADVWGDIEWEGEPPPEPIKAAAEEAIKNDWQPEEGSSCFIRQTIPKMPGWPSLGFKKPGSEWKAMPLGDTGAEIYTFDDDTTFD